VCCRICFAIFPLNFCALLFADNGGMSFQQTTIIIIIYKRMEIFYQNIFKASMSFSVNANNSTQEDGSDVIDYAITVTLNEIQNWTVC